MAEAAELMPFLERIDAARWYSNSGPLVRELELTLGAMMGAEVVTTCNGTLALEMALRALQLPRDTEVLVPTVTFIATARAIIGAGLQPMICDVDPVSWMLTPAIARNMPRTRVVMPVAAFGMPVDVAAWEAWAEENDCLVVIDAAGALPGQQASKSKRVTVVCSLHSTKSIGGGEGGLVASSDPVYLDRVRRLCNFGFGAVINKEDGATNAKLSEYHAAVALANLQPARLALKKIRSRAIASQYFAHLPESIRWQEYAHVIESRTLMPVLLPEHILATGVALVLQSHDIETRQWYVPFLHDIPAFKPYVRTGRMHVPDMLTERMLGLPFHLHLEPGDVEKVCGLLRDMCELS